MFRTLLSMIKSFVNSHLFITINLYLNRSGKASNLVLGLRCQAQIQYKHVFSGRCHFGKVFPFSLPSPHFLLLNFLAHFVRRYWSFFLRLNVESHFLFLLEFSSNSFWITFSISLAIWACSARIFVTKSVKCRYLVNCVILY